MKLPAVVFIVTAALVLQNAVVQQRAQKGIPGAVARLDAAGISLRGEGIPWAPPTPGDSVIRIKFQPADAPVPAGYLVDSGAVFGDRGNGYRYGWALKNTTAHNRNAPDDLGYAERQWPSGNTTAQNGNAPQESDQRYGALIHLQWAGADHVWELELPNGLYSVRLVAGDPSYFDSFYILSVEGVIAVNDIPTSDNRWIEGTVQVKVADGRLTIFNATGACNNKLAFIEITPAAAGPLPDPAVASPISVKPAAAAASPGPEPAPAAFEGRGGVITGVVRTKAGAPMAGVRVAAISMDGATGASVLFGIARTDTAGRYLLEDIPNGRYNVVVGTLTTPFYHPGVNATGVATTFTLSGKPVVAEDFSVDPARLELVCPSGTGPKG